MKNIVTIKAISIFFFGFLSFTALAEGDPTADPMGSQTENATTQILNDAINALYSDDASERQKAIHLLAGIKDESAISALISAATSGDNSDERVIATHALWKNAANGGFNDSSAVSALNQLANDENESIKRIALDALADMENN